MNGVRRFLAGGTTGSQSPPPTASDILPPLVPTGKPSWPPQSPSPTDSPIGSSKISTQPLFLRKDKQKPLPDTQDDAGNLSRSSGRSTHDNSFTPSSRGISSASLSRNVRSISPATRPSSPLAPSTLRKSINPQESEWKTSGLLNTRDELLISLLSSEAVVDSREFEILTAELVEELKKVSV
jgi:hypothetical protein